MKYKPPAVEESQESEDATKHPKRKRGLEETTTSQEQSLDEAELQPPSKASKVSETPGLDDDDDFSDYDDNEQFEKDLSEEGDEEFEEIGEEQSAEEEEEEGGGGEEEEEEEEEEAEEEDTGQKSQGSPKKEKLQKTVEKYGRAPLEGTSLAEKALTGSPDTILAMLIEAMLKSKPISHRLVDRTVNKIVDVGFCDIEKLGGSSWEERAMVLEDGGYNRYREQGSTNLGELVELVNEKYDGDLNNLIKKADYDRAKARRLVKEVKGLGDLGVDLFFNNVQSVWPSIAPFVDSRSLQTANEVGFGTDLDAMYAGLERDSVRMCKLANALSTARLERRLGDLMAI